MRIDGIPIKDLKQDENINGFYILRRKELKEASNKKFYLDLTFSDNTGEINGKLWDVTEDIFLSMPLNMLYYVYARVDCWKENMQLNIQKIRLADHDDQKKIDKFVPSATISPEIMLKEVYSYSNRIQHDEIRRLVTKMLKDKEDRLIYNPAARSLHHSI